MSKTLRDIVQIRGQFHRSVNLDRDFNTRGNRQYLLTPTAETLASRIVEESQRGSRVWSLTGPFGTGKSAFALFLAEVLAGGSQVGATEKGFRKTIGRGRKDWGCGLHVGSRQTLAEAFLGMLAGAAAHLDSNRLKNRIHRILRGKQFDQSVVIAIAEELFDRAAAEKFPGMLLVVDEFGKLLEHIALAPTQDDVFLAQTLAEAVARDSLTGGVRDDPPCGLYRLSSSR